MLEDCHSGHDAAQLYRARFGWEVMLTGGHPYVTAGDGISAVEMPARLGISVLLCLDESVSVPVVVSPHPPRMWIFLVAATSSPIPRYQRSRLEKARVAAVAEGAPLWLPISERGAGAGVGGWSWASAPVETDDVLPRRSRVLGAARSVLVAWAADRQRGY